jgi:RHS repeat-associated core domain
MRHKKPIQLLLCFVVFLGFHQLTTAQTWNPTHAIASVNGVYSFSNSQIPSQLVELYPAAIPNSGLAYQWEQSTTPISGFSAVPPGGTLSSYTFTAPLTQTMYFRRKTMDPNHGWAFIYSNVLKISVVSQNWEDLNYIREHDVITTGITTWQAVDQLTIGSKLQSTTYLDGLGRQIQKVSRETAVPSSGTLWGDIVKFFQYDIYGRQQQSYLAYTTTNQSGKFKTTANTDQGQYYTSIYNETSPSSNLTFDKSPLNRVVNVKEPGTVWAASVGKSATYDLNTVSDDIKYFNISYVQGTAPTLGGTYLANTLYKLIYTDENGKQIIEFRDKSGKLLFKKVQLSDTPGASYSGWICTYFIYDDFGLLRYQLQPEAVNWLSSNNWDFSVANGSTVLAEWCFQYNYDDKGRMIWKKAPGAVALNMLYDKRDRLVYAQDGNQLALSTPQWTATVYDDLDRPLLMTLYNTTKTIANLQSDISNAPPYNLITISNTSNNGGSSTSINSYLNPLTSTDLNTITTTSVLKYLFYDNYSFTNVKIFNTNFTNLTAYNTSDPNVQVLSNTSRTTNMPTGSMVRVLSSNTFINATSYYDDRGSLIQTLQDNIKSGVDISTLQYHFDGKLLSTCSDHTNSGAGFVNYKILTKYLFDKLGRVTSIQKQFGTNALKTVASYDYDDVGRIKTKHLDPGYTNNGGTELESLNYSFNIHNQLTGINKDFALKNPGNYNKWGHFFGLYLGFDNRDNIFTHAQLNGQVTGILWNTQGDDAQRKYDYTFDNTGRLTNADFKEQQHPGDGWANTKMDFSIGGYTGKITYDLNGNILSMSQKGVMPGITAPIIIDDLRYSYASFSNKLQSVTDQMTTISSNGLFGDFKDGSNGSNPDYVYDNNGNVVIDLNKNAKDLNNVVGANGIHYNYIDKPDQIRIAGKGTINIVYSGDGEKLQRTFTPETGTATTTTYINQFVYQSSGSGADVLSFINFEEGRIRLVTPTTQNNGYDQLTVDGNLDLPNSKRGAYDYFILDYLQNVRMILSEETHVAGNTATMETSRASIEDPIFGQVGASNEVEATRYPKSSTNWTGNTSVSVCRLGNNAGHNIGPNTLQKVMAGDIINANVQYYYPSSATGNNPNFISNVVSSLVSALTNGPTSNAVKSGATNIGTNLNGNSSFISAVQPSTNTGTTPLAYLTILFFDERFNLIPQPDGGVYQVQVASSVSSNGLSLPLNGIKSPKNGYVYIYVSNQSNQDVYFDNLSVTITQGNIIEENHYYSFGLRISAISSKKYADTYDGKINNPFLYNGKEMLDDDADLNWYDYGYRNYDPQIGRFMQLDPLTDNYPFLTPYQYASNDPITNIDIDGLEGGSAVGGVIEGLDHAGFAGHIMDEVVVTAIVKATGKASNGVTIYKVIRTSFQVVKATNIVSGIFQAGYTSPVGQNVSESVCQNCAQREMQLKMAPIIQEMNEERNRPPEFRQGKLDAKAKPAEPKQDYYTIKLRNELRENLSNRAGDGFPIIGNLVKAGRMENNSFHSEAWSSFKSASTELALTISGEYLLRQSGVFLKYANTGSKIKYIGRMEDLKNIPREQTLLDELPYLFDPKANYYQNMSVLRKAIREGYTIRDASWFRPNSELAGTATRPTRTIGQTFLGAERLLLKNRGLLK